MPDVKKFWMLNDFAAEVAARFSQMTGEPQSTHFNTMNKWFNRMEERGIHTPSRNEKHTRIFDTLDLDIALYIWKMRTEGFQLEAILNILPNQFTNLRVPLKENSNKITPDLIQYGELKEQVEEITDMLKTFNPEQPLKEFGKILDRNIEKRMLYNRSLQEISQIQLSIDGIDQHIENLESNKRYIELINIKNSAEQVRPEKSKGFWSRIIGAKENPAGESEENTPIAEGIQKELDKLDDKIKKFQKEREEKEELLNDKKAEINSLEAEVNQVRQLLLSDSDIIEDYTEEAIHGEREETTNESN